jgi:hypothetical protein
MKYGEIFHLVIDMEMDEVIQIVEDIEKIKGFMEEGVSTFKHFHELYKLLKNVSEGYK